MCNMFLHLQVLVAIFSIISLFILSSSHGFVGLWVGLTIYMSLRTFAGFWRLVSVAKKILEDAHISRKCLWINLSLPYDSENSATYFSLLSLNKICGEIIRKNQTKSILRPFLIVCSYICRIGTETGPWSYLRS